VAARRVLLFLHGLPDTGRCWHDVTARLADVGDCHAPDLPGFGDSAPPGRLRTLADLRGLVDERLLPASLPPRFGLVVHDVGALFGLAWAVDHVDRLDALVILNASVFADRRWHWGARLLRVPAVGEVAMRLMREGEFGREVRRASNGRRATEEIARTFRAFGPRARATALQLYRLQRPAFFEDLPARVRALTAHVPTLVLWGDRDPYLPPAFAESFGAGTVRHDAEAGHWPHIEAPTQVAADIRAFLRASADAGLRPV